MVCRGVFQGGVVRFEGEVGLRDGERVDVRPARSAADAPARRGRRAAKAAEMLEGVKDRADLGVTLAFLGAFRGLAVRAVDFDARLTVTAESRLSHGVGWPDCLIAATCLRARFPLATLNENRFRPVRVLRVVRPY